MNEKATALGYNNGHKVEFVDGVWYYMDTSEPTHLPENNRACSHCEKLPTKEGHDACLKTLPGLQNACCGHGRIDEAYIHFRDGEAIYGADAISIIEILKKYRQ
jgi:hypothetical protein